MRPPFWASFFGCLILAALATFGQARAQSTPAPSPTPSRWQLRVTPYVWLPTINGSLHYAGRDVKRFPNLPPPSIPTGANIKIGPNSYLTNLNSALLFAVDLHKGDGGIFTDFIYMNLTSKNASVVSLNGPGGRIVIPVNVALDTHLSSTLWTLALYGSPISTSGPSPLDAFVGVRSLNLNTSADWNLKGPLGLLNPAGSASRNETQVIPIGGIRGHIGLGPHWFVPYYVDYGGNSDVNSWQGILGVGYGYRSGAALLVWRQISYFNNNSQTQFIQNIHLGGPTVGWTFDL